MKNFILFVTILISTMSFAQTKPTVVVLYTKAGDAAEEFENITDAAKFAVQQYNAQFGKNLDFNFVEIDDQDNPDRAEKELKKVFKSSSPLAILGPMYSNVGLALKPFVNEKQIPMISIFATHNDLTKNAPTVFQMCTSNQRMVRTMSEYLKPLVAKSKLDVSVFKDLTDFYSTDLADSFKNYMTEKTNINEVLFRGMTGLERLKDVNSKVWSPTKKDIVFLATQDLISSRILTSFESEPYAVATIDPVNFQGILQKTKKTKIHIRMISTAQWLPGRSEFSKKIEKAFKDKFKREMKTPSALAFDSAFALAAAYDRSLSKKIPLAQTLRDGTKVLGMTGNLALGPDGERINSGAFVKEDILQ